MNILTKKQAESLRALRPKLAEYDAAARKLAELLLLIEKMCPEHMEALDFDCPICALGERLSTMEVGGMDMGLFDFRSLVDSFLERRPLKPKRP